MKAELTRNVSNAERCLEAIEASPSFDPVMRLCDMAYEQKLLLDKYKAAVIELHSQHGDDLCWMPADVNKVFVAFGLPPQDLRVGDKPTMRKNCDRYIDCLESGGPWRSYAEIEQENEDLKKEISFLKSTDSRNWT